MVEASEARLESSDGVWLIPLLLGEATRKMTESWLRSKVKVTLRSLPVKTLVVASDLGLPATVELKHRTKEEGGC